MSNYYNLMSTLEHEGFHKQRGHGFGVENYLDHAQVYVDQIMSDTFDKTSSIYKNGAVGGFVEMLNKANDEYGIGNRQVDMKNQVNEKLKELNLDYRVIENLGSGKYEVQ